MTGYSALISRTIIIIMAVNLPCGVPDCGFTTGDGSENVTGCPPQQLQPGSSAWPATRLGDRGAPRAAAGSA